MLEQHRSYQETGERQQLLSRATIVPISGMPLEETKEKVLKASSLKQLQEEFESEFEDDELTGRPALPLKELYEGGESTGKVYKEEPKQVETRETEMDETFSHADSFDTGDGLGSSDNFDEFALPLNHLDKITE